MRSERPPFLATWLLRRLYSGPHRESVIGDLLEHYHHRKSHVWYWRQILTTIVVSLAWAIRADKALAIRAVLSGYAATWCLGFVLASVGRGPVGTVVEALSGESRHVFFGTWVPFITLAGAGWIVARVHRRHRGAMLFLFAASMVLIDIPELHRRMANAMVDDRYIPALRSFLSAESIGTLAILLGGLSQPPSRPDEIRQDGARPDGPSVEA